MACQAEAANASARRRLERKRGSNPRPTAWKAVTLPLSYSRLRDSHLALTRRFGGQARRHSQTPHQQPPYSPSAFAFCRRDSLRAKVGSPSRSSRFTRAEAGGEGRVRTSVARRRQFYSLLRLTALPPPRKSIGLAALILQTDDCTPYVSAYREADCSMVGRRKRWSWRRDLNPRLS